MKRKKFTKIPILERMKDLKDETGYTHKKISELSGIPFDTVKKWFADSSQAIPEVENLPKIAKAFGVSVDYLICNTEYRNIGNKEISEQTGLSERSIDTLRQINKDSADKDKNLLPLMDFIMSDPELFIAFLSNIKLYVCGVPFTVPVDCYPDFDGVHFIENQSGIFGFKSPDSNNALIVSPDFLQSVARVKVDEILKKWKDNYK